MYILRNKMTVYDNPVFFRRGCAIVNSEKWSETETTEREILQEMKYQNIIENMTLKKPRSLAEKASGRQGNFQDWTFRQSSVQTDQTVCVSRLAQETIWESTRPFRQPVFQQQQPWQTAGMKNWSRR
jgi:hypothetical protein